MDSRTWQQPQPRGSVYAEKTTWLLVAAFALLLAGLMVNQSTTAFFTDTRVVSGNNFITASVALNETPFTAFNFEKFVPGDVFVRPVQVTNSTASNSGAINVNYYMTVKDNFTTGCSVQDPTCPAAKGTLSDATNGLRLVAIRCFSDALGKTNVACESSSLRSVRLIKGAMETIWPGGAGSAKADIAGVVRDRNETVQYGNVGGTGSENTDFPGLPNSGNASDYFGRPIVFARAGALSTQPISVKINPRRNDTNNPSQPGNTQLTNTAAPVVQGSDVLRIGGTIQDLDGNWARAAKTDGSAADAPYQSCGDIKISGYSTNLSGCGAEVIGVPIQTLSNPNCNGLGSSAANRAVPNATGGQGSQAGPAANANVGVTPIAVAGNQSSVFSTQSHGACLMGGAKYETNSPVVLSPRINNQLMTAGGGETPRILSDIPAQSLADSANTLAGLAAGDTDNFALVVYLPSWATQSTQSETGTTNLTVQSRQTTDAQGNPTSIPIGGAGNGLGGKASYTVAFTAVQPVGQTFALANVAQQSVNTLAALAGQVTVAGQAAFQAQSSNTGAVSDRLVTGGIQAMSPNTLPGGGTQTISVAGRGFAQVTAVPQNLKVALGGAAFTNASSGSIALTALTADEVGTTVKVDSVGDTTLAQWQAVGWQGTAVPSSGATFKVTSSSGGGGTGKVFKATGLATNKTYSYYVTASELSTALSSVHGWLQGEPTAAVSVTIASSDTKPQQATVSWNHVPGMTNYHVYRSDGSTWKRYDISYGAFANTATTAGSFVAGKVYKINSVSDTDFTKIGAPNNTPGTVFTATGNGASNGTGDAYAATDALSNSAPVPAGYVSGSVVGFVDDGTTTAAASLSTAEAVYFPAVGRPCVAYDTVATIGMCPKVEILASSQDGLTGTALSGASAWTVTSGEIMAATSGSEGTQRLKCITTAGATATSGSNDPRSALGTGDCAYLADNTEVAATTGTLLQLDATKKTNAKFSFFAATANTAGFVSSNQVTVRVTTKSQTPASGTLGNTFGLRITNPNHPSLSLDVRDKVAVAKDGLTVLGQQLAAVDAYSPAKIGRISTGNKLVIKGFGIQKNAIVQLGFFGTLSSNTLSRSAGSASSVSKDSTNFLSRSHILNRPKNTLETLGSSYATGYNSDVAGSDLTTAVNTSTLEGGYCLNEAKTAPLTGAALTACLQTKLVPARAGSELTLTLESNRIGIANMPVFSYDHDKVVINNDGQITITDITVTNAVTAPGKMAAKIFNPDGSVIQSAQFDVVAPGIEQIVQAVYDNASPPAVAARWLSAAQGQTVKLQFKANASNTFVNTATGSPPSIRTIECFGVMASTTSTTGGADGSSCNVNGVMNSGVTQIGDLKVLQDSAGTIVEGTFAIASDAKIGLRKFTMENGDKAVFANYFSVSAAPRFDKVSYTSGTNRIVTDATSNVVAAGTTTVNSEQLTNTLSTSIFNIDKGLPRGAVRRVLITGESFVRGSYAGMVDPLVTGSEAATAADSGTITVDRAGTADDETIADGCASCFGARSANSLVLASISKTTTPKIRFSNAGVKLVTGGSIGGGTPLTFSATGSSPLTAVVKDNATALSIGTTTDQGVGTASPFVPTKRLTAVIYVDPSAPAGPVTMTITNPDGGEIVAPNAFVVDGRPTVDVARNAIISDGTISANFDADPTVASPGWKATSPVSSNNATIAQGQTKNGANAIYIYGSGFFAQGGRSPDVQIGGTGVRVIGTHLGVDGPIWSSNATDITQMDTVLRVELAAESTAPLASGASKRDITIVLPDGQSVTLKAALEVTTP